MHVRSGGIMPNVTPSPERGPKSVARGGPKSILKGRTPGKTPGRGGRLTFGSDDVKHMTDSDGEGSSPEADENRAPRTMVAKGTAQDPFGLDDLKTPTPPRPLAEVLAYAAAKTPNWAKTPNTAGRKTVGFGASFGNEPPPTHSKALAAALASAAKPGKTLNYSKHKETIAKALYNEFNNDAFDGKLPAKFDISWNAKLLTTAGLTHYKKVTRSTGLSEYSARIELSTKVLDCAEKLEATLLHEMCHAAAWLLDHQAKPPHGATFKKWANQAMRTYPDVSVDTCHSYEIFQPYRYRCTQQWCNTEYGRHSKSIDVEAKACGVCNGRLEYLGKFNPDGTKAEEKAPTAFSLFVKEHFAATKERLPRGDAAQEHHEGAQRVVEERREHHGEEDPGRGRRYLRAGCAGREHAHAQAVRGDDTTLSEGGERGLISGTVPTCAEKTKRTKNFSRRIVNDESTQYVITPPHERTGEATRRRERRRSVPWRRYASRGSSA